MLPFSYSTSQVQPVYKVGCRGCDTKDFTPQLCPSCKEESKKTNTTRLTQIIEAIEKELYPEFESDTTMSDSSTLMEDEMNVELNEPKKRGHEDDINDESKTKNPRNATE